MFLFSIFYFYFYYSIIIINIIFILLIVLSYFIFQKKKKRKSGSEIFAMIAKFFAMPHSFATSFCFANNFFIRTPF